MDPRFSNGGGGGGGGGRGCINAKSFTAGVQGRGHGSSRVLDALSCYLTRILKYSDTKWDTKNKTKSIVDQGGGGVLLCPCLVLPLPAVKLHCLSIKHVERSSIVQ